MLKKASKWGSSLVDYIGKHIHKHSVIGWFAYFVVILGILVGITLVGYYFSLGVEENDGISQFIGMSGLLLTLLGTAGIFITLYRVSSLGNRRYSPNEFLQEVEAVIRSAKPSKDNIWNKEQQATNINDADLHYMCMVHDPGIANDDAHIEFSALMSTMYKKFTNSEIKKRIAILDPGTIDWEMKDPLEHVLGDLFRFEFSWASARWRIKNGETLTGKWDTFKGSLSDSGKRDDKGGENRFANAGVFKKMGAMDDGSSRNKFLEKSFAAFFGLFVDEKNNLTEWDKDNCDLLLYRLKVPCNNPNGFLENSPFADAKIIYENMCILTEADTEADTQPKLQAINIFCSKTRGFMAFINFCGDGAQATIDGLPVHDEKFVHLLVQFFNSITNGSEPIMLGKYEPRETEKKSTSTAKSG